MFIRLFLCMCGVLFGISTPVHAKDEAVAFLKSLEGEFRGRGLAFIEATNREERVSCKIENVFDASALSVSIKGVCATTQGKTEVEGLLTHSQEAGVEGNLFSPSADYNILSTESTFSDGILVLLTEMENKDDGQKRRNRQTISVVAAGSEFKTAFERYDFHKKLYVDIGSMTFKAR